VIGNDIVDLSEAKKTSNWQHPRFLEKLFTEKEQHYINNSEDEFIKIWQLWSMKEAAYKLYTQKKPSRFYAPKAFECFVSISGGKVKYKNFECDVSTQITTNYIVSEAQFIQQKIRSKVLEFKDEDLKKQSQFLKHKLLEQISRDYNILRLDLVFQKSEFGIPTVNYNSETINVSLTHHGKFGAFAISNNKRE